MHTRTLLPARGGRPLAVVLGALLLAGCVTATPVTPAPLAPARARRLRCLLRGRWENVSVGGRRLTTMRVTFRFRADGTGVYRQRPRRAMPLRATAASNLRWRLDGRNLTLTLPDGHVAVHRVDGFGPGRMDWFDYAVSEHYVLVRVGPPPACP